MKFEVPQMSVEYQLLEVYHHILTSVTFRARLVHDW